MAELRIPLIVENKGKKALGDVDKGIKGITKSFSKLAGAAGISLSTAAVINFGKQSVKAFMADQKAASQLALSVKNLGLAFETPVIEQFISQLSKASGVTDDMLRPSMQKLLQTTGSVKKSTELLTQALDISRGSGVDYETVVSDLSAAYLGQTKGLTKYSLGITKAELKTMSFADIQEKLTKQFSGANAAYLETYAGKMQILGTAAGEAQEIIGKGLVDSLSILAGEGNTIQPLADSMEQLATEISSVLTGLATMVAEFKKLPGVEKYISDIWPKIMELSLPGQLKSFIQGFSKITTPGMGGYPSSALGGTFIDPNEAARKKAEAEALKRAKALAALQTKALADSKKKVALEKAARLLELDRINIAAALKGQISETDRLSLNLQLALLDKNDAQATKLSGELSAAVKRQNELNAALLATPEAPNPYRNWKAPDMGPIAMAGAVTGGGYGGLVPNFNVPDYAKDSYSQVGPLGGLGAGVIAGVNPTINVTVELDGQAVGGAIRDSQINDSLSGSFSQTNRFAAKGSIAT
jgi:hypothetical protein